MSFAVDISKFVNKAKGNMNKVVQHLTIRLWEGVDALSPVGNPSLWDYPPPPGYVGGHFRRNWQVEINSIPSTVKSGEDPSGSISLTENTLTFNSIKAGQRIFIVNPVSYGPVLEKGRHIDESGIVRGSTQAPAGIVGPVLDDFKNFVIEAGNVL